MHYLVLGFGQECLNKTHDVEDSLVGESIIRRGLIKVRWGVFFQRVLAIVSMKETQLTSNTTIIGSLFGVLGCIIGSKRNSYSYYP